MLRKSIQIVILAPMLIFTFTATLLLPETALAITAPSPPDLYIQFTPELQAVSEGCPASYTARLVSLEGFYGMVNLTVVDPPKGVTATFYPNPVEVPAYNDNFARLRVEVSPDTPQGNQTLYVRAIPLPGGNNIDVNGYFGGKTHITLYVGSCGSLPSEVKTTTITSTSQTTITTTVTVISTTAETKTAVFTTYTETKTIPTNWLDLIQATSIGIGIAVAGMAIALAISRRQVR